MTPEQALKLLEGTTPGPWGFDTQTYEEPCYPELVVDFQVTTHNGNQVAVQTDFDSDAYESGRNFNLMAAAPDMAEMIANMTTEYSVQLADGELVGAGWGTHETAWCDCDAWQRDGYDARIVCRYVTAPQPLEGEEQ